MVPITSFKGEYRWLSNFHLCQITGTPSELVFPSTENIYQACKSEDPEVWKRFSHLTPREAKAASKKLVVRANWETWKVPIMFFVNMQKYSKYDDLKAKLLATDDAELIEGNTWGDTYWGQCPIGTGDNHLGKILMDIRNYLRSGTEKW